MSKHYICSVTSRFPENYDLGVRLGKWGVEAAYEKKIAPVRPGDFIVFIVAGEFRSIHRILRGPYEDRSLIWPPKDGDIFPFRVDIGPAEVSGHVRVADLVSRISCMKDTRAWGGVIQGRNGVFNDRFSPEDIRLITARLEASGQEERPKQPLVIDPFFQPEGAQWLPALLDELAARSRLVRATGFADPFSGADEWHRGIMSQVYSDERRTPTLAILPVDREPRQTVLSALYGMSALRQSQPAVRGIIFVPQQEPTVASLLSGVSNLETVAFNLQVSLRN